MTAYDCQACGACCATDQVVVVRIDEPVPRYLTRSVRRTIGFASWEAYDTRQMARDNGRCAAFRGEVGHACGCATYERRPAVCQEFEPGGEACRDARAALGLP